MKTKRAHGKKKTYRSPRLQTYGDFRKLTQTGKGGNKADGAGVPKTRSGSPLAG